MSTGPALLTQFTALETATVSDALDACGLPPGQGGLRPMWGRPKVAGFAVTVELESLSGQPGAEHGGAHILTGAIAEAGPATSSWSPTAAAPTCRHGAGS